MNDEENKKEETDVGSVNEPAIPYPFQQPESNSTVQFFSSLNEMGEAQLKKMAAMSHTELMSNLNVLRRIAYKEFVDADGNWLPLKRVIRITEPKVNERS